VDAVEVVQETHLVPAVHQLRVMLAVSVETVVEVQVEAVWEQLESMLIL
jgi:hypothetical protein